MSKAASAVSACQENSPNDQGPEAKTDMNNDDISLAQVLHLAQSSVETLKNFLTQLDNTIGDDFHQIMDKISQTREDMVHLNIKSDDDDDCPIADAENELKLVVKATEDATNRIMESAESIMTADPNDQAHYHSVVEKNVMDIFEACSFQDITGQRINKVVETLEFVDYRVHKIAALLGIEQEFGNRDFDENAFHEKRKRKDELILHGPQDKALAVSQDDIDDLF